MNSGRAALLDSERMIGQLCALQRSTARSRGDKIDHPRGAGDDLCNAACGALVETLTRASRPRPLVGLFGPQVFDGFGRVAGTPAFETPMPRTRLPHEIEAEMKMKETNDVATP